MDNNYLESAAFIFPLPAHLKEQYLKWTQSFQQSPSSKKTLEGSEDQDSHPIFIPVYPAYPGFMPYPSFYPGNPCGVGNCGGGAVVRSPANNPFILFLILILLFIVFKKDQILEAIRKLLLKTTAGV